MTFSTTLQDASAKGWRFVNLLDGTIQLNRNDFTWTSKSTERALFFFWIIELQFDDVFELSRIVCEFDPLRKTKLDIFGYSHLYKILKTN